MNADRVHDAIVVGAGPAGSACSIVLARNGLDVLLIDRSYFPREKICGDCLNPGSWETLEFLGAGDSVKAAPHQTIAGVRIASWQGRSVRKSLPRDVRKPFIAIRRSILDEILLHGAEKSGVTIHQGTQVVRVEAGRTIRVHVRGSSGEWSLSCRSLVGADGRNSVVAASLRAPGRRKRQPDRIGLQWFAPFQPSLANEVLLLLLPFGYLGIVNVDEWNANIAMSVDPRHVPGDHRAIPAYLAESMKSMPFMRHLVHDLTPHSEILTASPVHPRTNVSTNARILLAGDARQTVEPFTGEGIVFALSDGLKRASMVLAFEGKTANLRVRPRNGFWVNSIYSQLLRHPRVLNTALGHPGTSSLFAAAMKTVFR